MNKGHRTIRVCREMLPGEWFRLLRCFVAGFQYHDGPELLGDLREGEMLKLKPEPGNPFDPCAVRVVHSRGFLGYLPRDENRVIHRLLRQGAPVLCRIIEVSPEEVPWKSLRIEVAISCKIVSSISNRTLLN